MFYFSGKLSAGVNCPTFPELEQISLGQLSAGEYVVQQRMTMAYADDLITDTVCTFRFSVPAETSTNNVSWVGAVWSYCRYDYEEYQFVRYTVLNRPETIDGHTYYPLVRYTTCEYQEEETDTLFRIRQEGKKVYIRKEDFNKIEAKDFREYYKDNVRLKEDGDDYLLYDFSLELGDEYCQLVFERETEALSLTGIETVRADDEHTFRRLKIENQSGGSDVWIDGIGSSFDLLFPYTYPEVDCPCSSVLNYFRSADGSFVYSNPITANAYSYDFFREDDCALSAPAKSATVFHFTPASVQTVGSVISCISHRAVKLEVYTLDAMKVGETSFTNVEAAIKVDKAPAAYLYIVTYPDGRRESGKVIVR